MKTKKITAWVVAVIALLLSATTLHAQSRVANDGVARPVTGAHWDRPVIGAFCKASWQHRWDTPSGRYNLEGYNQPFWVERPTPQEGVEVLFTEYAPWNRGYLTLQNGEGIVSLSPMRWVKGNDGYEYLVSNSGLYLDRCGNALTRVRRPARCKQQQQPPVVVPVNPNPHQGGGTLTGNLRVDLNRMNRDPQVQLQYWRPITFRVLGVRRKVRPGWAVFIDGLVGSAVVFLAGDLLTDGNVDGNWRRESPDVPDGGNEPNGNNVSGGHAQNGR